MNNAIVSTADHSNIQLFAGIFIIAAIVLVIYLLIFLKRKNTK